MTTARYSTTRSDGSRSYGPAAVRLLSEIGIELMPWQIDVFDQMLECDTDGNLTRKTAVLICPRRNGKSIIAVARLIVGALFLDESMQIASAHMADTSSELWKMIVSMAQHPLLAARIRATPRAEGRQRIIFDNGHEISFRTRTGHGGRGMECSTLLLDEAMILDSEQVAALAPLTARAAANGRGQILYFSSAGNESSVVLGALRDRGRELDGTDGSGMMYVEYCVDRGADPDDPESWRAANPSLGTSILAEDYFRDARSRMATEIFSREHLGVWGIEEQLPVIDPAEWEALKAEEPPEYRDAISWMTFDVSIDQTEARVMLFRRSSDARIVVRCVDSHRDPDGIHLEAYRDRVLGLAQKYDPDLIGFERQTGTPIGQHLAAFGWEKRLRPMTVAKAAQGVANLVAAVRGRSVVHDGHEDISADLARAIGRPYGDGGQTFTRARSTTGPICGAIAVSTGFSIAHDEELAIE